jgi:predicted dehydrogenase
MQQVRKLIAEGALGRVHAADLVFHNAYGPDKPWFYDPAQSGGGCVMDLGTHLVDLGLWALDFPDVVNVVSHLRAGGAPLTDPDKAVEDFALATLECANGAVLRLACSWRLHAGRDALIGATFHGTEGGASFHNVDGSFYDFTAERYSGTETRVLVGPPDAWGGRAGAAWARCLAEGNGYDAAADRLTDVARVIDRIYGRF